jgi:3',5'-cyclic-AMP phosphodiesterase
MSAPDLDVVIVSGDIADDGSVAGCEAVRDRVGPFAADHGTPHVYSTGNHDDRESFREVLGTGHLGPDGTDRGELLDPEANLCAAVSHVQGLRIITLDSLIPGETHGVITEGQLAGLGTRWPPRHRTEPF